MVNLCRLQKKEFKATLTHQTRVESDVTHMHFKSIVLSLMAAGLTWVNISVSAQIQIDSITRDGEIHWTARTNGLARFRVEWAPTVLGPWHASWESLSNFPLSNTTFTARVPLFYRVVADILPGEICATAEPVGAGTYWGSTLGFTNDLAAGQGCIGTGGPDRFYMVQVPSVRKLVATVTPLDGTYDPSLNLSSGCAGGCLAGADAGGGGILETLQYANTSINATPVLVVVGSSRMDNAGSGPFELNVQFEPLPEGEICATASLLTPGFTLNNQTTAGFQSDFSATAACLGLACPGPDRFYSVTVPAGQQLTVHVVPAAGWDPAVYVLNNCGLAVCLAGVDNGGDSEPESVTYRNTGNTAQRVILGVDSVIAGNSGTFSISSSVQP